jgi:hypothetical protein
MGPDTPFDLTMIPVLTSTARGFDQESLQCSFLVVTCIPGPAIGAFPGSASKACMESGAARFINAHCLDCGRHADVQGKSERYRPGGARTPPASRSSPGHDADDGARAAVYAGDHEREDHHLCQA